MPIVSNWLYPLSRTSGCIFVDAEGIELSDTSFGSFKTMMQSSVSDDWWYLSTNFRNVRIDDRVWIYYGTADRDIGITGLATIRDFRDFRELDNDIRWPDIYLRWNRRATNRLIANPVPAKEVRKFIPWPAAAVWWATYPHLKLVDRLVKASGI
mgnify:CR=1 FL=1